MTIARNDDTILTSQDNYSLTTFGNELNVHSRFMDDLTAWCMIAPHAPSAPKDPLA
ncbi:hypothetical protein MTBLM5_100050 [Magnetospirillum sp. LM-5]|nr:hypothetical protein MTBLM5_100050 [Magnetospirillum sp. LM-5]